MQLYRLFMVFYPFFVFMIFLWQICLRYCPTWVIKSWIKPSKLIGMNLSFQTRSSYHESHVLPLVSTWRCDPLGWRLEYACHIFPAKCCVVAYQTSISTTTNLMPDLNATTWVGKSHDRLRHVTAKSAGPRPQGYKSRGKAPAREIPGEIWPQDFPWKSPEAFQEGKSKGRGGNSWWKIMNAESPTTTTTSTTTSEAAGRFQVCSAILSPSVNFLNPSCRVTGAGHRIFTYQTTSVATPFVRGYPERKQANVGQVYYLPKLMFSIANWLHIWTFRYLVSTRQVCWVVAIYVCLSSCKYVCFEIWADDFQPTSFPPLSSPLQPHAWHSRWSTGHTSLFIKQSITNSTRNKIYLPFIPVYLWVQWTQPKLFHFFASK